MGNPQILFDFTGTQPVPIWQPINDVVMGGCSNSQAELLESGGMRFSGHVSLENNGGFASLRSATGAYNLADKETLLLRLQGDGKSYKLNLRSTMNIDGVVYQLAFTTAKDRAIELPLPLSDFRPYHHGWPRPEAGPLDRSQICSFGLLISQHQAGPFALTLYQIKAV